MKRNINTFLVEWKTNPFRKPLILQRAKHVGKTYSILEFGKDYYDNVAYFNFEANPSLFKIFEDNISPEYLVPILSKISKQTIPKGRTLIVFDEVKLCECSLTSVKYLYEEAPKYHIIVAGSLHGVAVNRQHFSFSVEKVMFKTMDLMDFEEFLMAWNENEFIEIMRECFEKNKPLPFVCNFLYINLENTTCENIFKIREKIAENILKIREKMPENILKIREAWYNMLCNGGVLE